MSDAPTLSVLIPVFNEGRTLEKVLHQVLAVRSVVEILVDDHSSDSTW